MARIIGMIFARGGSKGLPGKNLRPLMSKPLLAHAIQAAQAVPSIERVVVSTDDAAIAATAREYGAEVPFMRPAHLAADHSPEWEAWRHAIQTLQADDPDFEIMVSVPTTAPLRQPEDVQACLELLARSRADLVLTVTPAGSNPYFSMVTLDDTRARLAIPPEQGLSRRQDAPPVYDIVPLAYVMWTEYVLTHHHMFDGHVAAHIVPPERAVDIDTELDFRWAEFLMKERQA